MRRLTLPLVAGTFLIEVCNTSIAPAIAIGLVPTTHQSYINDPVALSDDCRADLPSNQTKNFLKKVSLPTESQKIDVLKFSNPKSLSLAQKPQFTNNAINDIPQMEILDGKSDPLYQPLNSQFPNAITQTTQDLCEVGLGFDTCEVGGGEVLCEVGGQTPGIGGGLVPPLILAGGGGPGLGFLPGVVPLLGLLRLASSSNTPAESSPSPPPEIPSPPESPPEILPPPESPPAPPIAAVPAPSTSLGGLVAIGIGILLKRKYAKISSRKAAKTISKIPQD